MKNLTLEHLADACGGRYTGPDDKKNLCVTDITTDSRKTTEGCLFVPIKGARVDAHEFIDCYKAPTYIRELIDGANAQINPVMS